MEQRVKKRIRFRDLAPARLILTGLLAVLVALNYALRHDAVFMERVYRRVTRPYHDFMGRLCGGADFSVAELIYAAAVVFVLVYIIVQAVLLIRRGERGRRVYKTVLTLAMTGLFFWAGFCYMWTPCYYAPTFAERSGEDAGPVSTRELEAVTAYFVDRVNEYAEQVERSGDGVFKGEREDILDRSAEVYGEIEEKWPFLASEPLRPKGMIFSKVMSLMDFTGFFFPLTGEANVNTDSPAVMLPATAEHEISHQRGVAAEQECNFLAVAACMESKYADYRYSGALLAYIYLGNALYEADNAAWQRVCGELGDAARDDLRYNSAYWERFDTAVKTVANTAYESFLYDNGQELGLKSYGACVDLLVHYYIEAAGS